jgi:glycine dehydrogenase subunit 1
MSYVGRSDAERQRMLESLGANDFDALLRDVPAEARLRRRLDLPGPLSEIEIRAELEALAARNDAAAGAISFLGGGMYDHYVPAIVPRLMLRSEFLTCYTPYQPEVSQGTLTVIFEFQSMIAELTALDVAQASLYDGGSAVAEACLLARAHTNRDRVVVAGGLHPSHMDVIKTIVGAEHVTHVRAAGGVAPGAEISRQLGADVAAVVLAYPNFFGIVEEGLPELAARARAAGALTVVCVDPLALALLTPPGQWGADICVGEGQPLGAAPSFGGPGFGFMAVRKELVRRLPGRLVGETVDHDGRRGFVLTLQTREQHIRREKATSNICTNQGLLALGAAIHLAVLGQQGLREVADLCFQKAHYAAARARQTAGLELAYAHPFFREFVLHLPVPASGVVRSGRGRGLLVGVDLGRIAEDWKHHLLVAVTEKRTKSEIDRWADCLAEAVGKRPTAAAGAGDR